MKSLKLFLFIALTSFIISCDGDNINHEEKQELDTEEATVRKKYTLSESSSTGWWTWTCKTGSPPKSGTESTKAAAKSEGKDNCSGAANVIITPPFETMRYEDMIFVDATIKDIFGEELIHTSESINENEIKYWMGVEEYDPISDSRKAIVYLTIFGIYNGGESSGEIQENHNLNQEQYELLISRNFTSDSSLDVDDETGELNWVF